MDVIQTARQLGKAIQQDDRYLRLMRAQQASDKDQGLQQAIDEFNMLRTKLNAEVQKQEKDRDKITELDTELKEKYALIFQNPNMNEFNEARNDLQGMLTFVNQIITGSAGGENPDEIEFQESCGGDCSGCAGCS